MLMTVIVPVLAFFALAAGVVVLGRAVARLQHDPIRDRLAAAFGKEFDQPLIPRGFADQLPPLTLNPTEVERDLRRAGYYRATAKVDFLAVRNALALLILIATGVAAVWIGPEREWLVWRVALGGVVLAAMVWASIRVILGIKARRRVRRINATLPDALDMVSMCMLGGLTLEDALGHVGRELCLVHPDLAVELVIIRQQADLNSMEFAFDQFARRIDAPDIVSLQSLIAQDRRLGSGIGRSIREFADALRTKRRQLADERSGAAMFKLLFPVTLCLVPASVLLLWTPACVTLFEFIRDLSNNSLIPPMN